VAPMLVEARPSASSLEESLEAMAAATVRQAAAPRAGGGIKLIPRIPPRDAIHTRSWLGGRPRLPQTEQWPRIEGVRADFLAQIARADLPRDLWNGLGPREGWLAIFGHPDTTAATAPRRAEGGPPP